MIAAGSVSGLASRSASSRAPAGVAVRSIVASSEPRRSPLNVRVSSRLARVAASISIVSPRGATRRTLQGRARFDLRARDIMDRHRRRADFGAAERAETVERLDAIELAKAPLGDVAAPPRRGRAGSRPRASRTNARAARGSSSVACGRHDLARFEPRDLDAQRRRVALAERKGAGRNIERGQAEKSARPRRREGAASRRADWRGPAPADALR